MRQITCDLIFQRWGWDNTQPIHPRCEKKGEAQLETIRCRTSTKKTQTSFETMNSMIMSSRKALVAKPTQSRRVASKATRRPVAMAGMQVRRRVCSFVCASSTSRVKCAKERERVVCGGCVDPRGLEPREPREPRSPCASPSVRTAAAAFFFRALGTRRLTPRSLYTHTTTGPQA